jgi:hypothetical protein
MTFAHFAKYGPPTPSTYQHHNKPTDLPVQFDSSYGEFVMLCPACGDSNTHVNNVAVISAGGKRISAYAYGEDLVDTVRNAKWRDQ